MDRTEWNRKLAAWREKLPAPLQNRTNLILFCAVLGIVFISLSYILEREPQQGNLDSGTPQSISTAERDLEQRLTEIVSHIDGAGRTTVMVTMDSTGEVVYAKDTSVRADASTTQESGKLSESSSSSADSSHIIIDGKDGDEPLVEKQIEPKVRGVIVLCEGADNPIVENRVTEAVKTALGISSSRICVEKISN